MRVFLKLVIFVDHLSYRYRRIFWKGKRGGGGWRHVTESPRSEAYQPPIPASASPSCNAINHHDKFNYPAVCDKARRASSLLSNFTYLASPLSFRPPLPLHPFSPPCSLLKIRCCSPRIRRETKPFRKLEVESFRFCVQKRKTERFFAILLRGDWLARNV